MAAGFVGFFAKGRCETSCQLSAGILAMEGCERNAMISIYSAGHSGHESSHLTVTISFLPLWGVVKRYFRLRRYSCHGGHPKIY